MKVEKCCCCLSLKYGVYTWAIIQLILRLGGMCGVYWIPNTVRDTGTQDVVGGVISTFLGGLFGWLLWSLLILVIALKGMAEKRAILIYPYLLMLIFEFVLLVVSGILMSALQTEWYLLLTLLSFVTHGYTIVCTISFYMRVKAEENKAHQVDTIPFKDA